MIHRGKSYDKQFHDRIKLTSFLTFRFGSSRTVIKLRITCPLYGSNKSVLTTPGKVLKHRSAADLILGGFSPRFIQAFNSLALKEDMCSFIASADSVTVMSKVSMVADLTLGSGRSRDWRSRGRSLPSSGRITAEGIFLRMLESATR